MIVWQMNGNVLLENEWDLLTLNFAFKADHLRQGALDNKQSGGANLNYFRVCYDQTQLEGKAAGGQSSG